METLLDIDMKYEDVQEQMQAIADRCETQEEVMREVGALEPDAKMQMVYALRTDEFFEDVKRESLHFIDWIESNHVINDHVRGCSKREPLVGMLRALAGMFAQSADVQARQEMQVMNKDTQYGMQLAEDCATLGGQLVDLVDQIITYSTHYQAVMTGRSMNVNYIDSEGAHVPYTPEHIAREQLMQQQAKDDIRSWLREEQEKREAIASPSGDSDVSQLSLPLGADEQKSSDEHAEVS